jgi:hypothetical protein
VSTLGTIRTRILQLTTNHIDQTTLDSLINRCAQEELEARPWTFRRQSTVVNSIAPYSVGLVDVTQGSNTILATGGSGTNFSSALVGYQFRIGAGANAVGLFTVQSVQSAVQLTLSTPYPGLSATAQPYFSFQQYYVITGADQILSVRGGNQLDLEEKTHEEINRADPLRQSTANPSVAWAPYGRSPTDDAQFEFWPVNSSAIPYVVGYLASFTTLVADTDRPLVPGPVVENKALADAAATIFSETGDPRWMQFNQTFWARYQKELEEAVMADEKRYGVQPQIRDANGGRVLGMDVLYNHDL